LFVPLLVHGSGIKIIIFSYVTQCSPVVITIAEETSVSFFTLSSSRWQQQASTKCCYLSTKPHCVVIEDLSWQPQISCSDCFHSHL